MRKKSKEGVKEARQVGFGLQDISVIPQQCGTTKIVTDTLKPRALVYNENGCYPVENFQHVLSRNNGVSDRLHKKTKDPNKAIVLISHHSSLLYSENSEITGRTLVYTRLGLSQDLMNVSPQVFSHSLLAYIKERGIQLFFDQFPEQLLRCFQASLSSRLIMLEWSRVGQHREQRKTKQTQHTLQGVNTACSSGLLGECADKRAASKQVCSPQHRTRMSHTTDDTRGSLVGQARQNSLRPLTFQLSQLHGALSGGRSSCTRFWL